MKEILVVEDEVLIAEHLKDTLLESGHEKVYLAHDKAKAIEYLRDKPNIALALLDIRMKGETVGIELAEHINENTQIPFIFITAHSDKETLYSALLQQPKSYITKPFKKPDVQAAVNLALLSSENNHKSLSFRDGRSIFKLALEEILFVQSDGNYIALFTEEKKHLIRHTMGWFENQVDPECFIRIHRTTIVNLQHIDRIDNKSVFIQSHELPLSRSYYKNLKQRFGTL